MVLSQRDRHASLSREEPARDGRRPGREGVSASAQLSRASLRLTVAASAGGASHSRAMHGAS